MKIQPKLEVETIFYDPRHPDSRETFPTLQVCETASNPSEKRHDHVLRAALLADNCMLVVPRKQ